jgi:hypothetical protein
MVYLQLLREYGETLRRALVGLFLMSTIFVWWQFKRRMRWRTRCAGRIPITPAMRT